MTYKVTDESGRVVRPAAVISRLLIQFTFILVSKHQALSHLPECWAKNIKLALKYMQCCLKSNDSLSFLIPIQWFESSKMCEKSLSSQSKYGILSNDKLMLYLMKSLKFYNFVRIMNEIMKCSRFSRVKTSIHRSIKLHTYLHCCSAALTIEVPQHM